MQPAKDSKSQYANLILSPSVSFNPSHPSMCSSPSCKWFTAVYHLLPRNAPEGEAKDQCSVCKPAAKWLLGTARSASWKNINKNHSIPFGQKVSLPAAAAKSTAPLRMDLSTTKLLEARVQQLLFHNACSHFHQHSSQGPAAMGIDDHAQLRYVGLIMPIPAKLSFK